MSEVIDPHLIDVHVGLRLKKARQEAKVTQHKLAKQIGVSYQQMQKYENATNRISAGRLYNSSILLNKPICFFFDGLHNQSEELGLTSGADIIKLFYEIQDAQLRAEVLTVLRALMDE